MSTPSKNQPSNARTRPVSSIVAVLVLSVASCVRSSTPVPPARTPVFLPDVLLHDASAAETQAPLPVEDAGRSSLGWLFCGTLDGRVPVRAWRSVLPRGEQTVVSELVSEELDGDGRQDILASVHYFCGSSDTGDETLHAALLLAWNRPEGWLLSDLWSAGESNIPQASVHASVLRFSGVPFIFAWGSANGSGEAQEFYAYRLQSERTFVSVTPELDFTPFFELSVRSEAPNTLVVEGMEDHRRRPSEQPRRSWRRTSRFTWDAASQRFTLVPRSVRR